MGQIIVVKKILSVVMSLYFPQVGFHERATVNYLNCWSPVPFRTINCHLQEVILRGQGTINCHLQEVVLKGTGGYKLLLAGSCLYVNSIIKGNAV